MVTYKSAADMAEAIRARRNRLERGPRSMLAGSEEAAKVAQKEAIALTSGGVSSAALAAAGHPFARKRALGRLSARGAGGASAVASYPLTPINKQSGRLVRSWRIFQRASGWRLQNMAPHAKFVLRPGGTKRMIDRRFWDELHRRALPKVRKLRLDYWRDATKG